MWVVIVPDYGTEAVPIHAITLTLALLRKLMWADQAVHDDKWGLTSRRPLHLPESLTAGIVACGRVGRRVAEFLNALGFRRILATGSGALAGDEARSTPTARRKAAAFGSGPLRKVRLPPRVGNMESILSALTLLVASCVAALRTSGWTPGPFDDVADECLRPKKAVTRWDIFTSRTTSQRISRVPSS